MTKINFTRMLKTMALVLPLLFWASSAWAGGVLNPGGGNNAWELYVFGNGAVIYNILNSVSAMVNDPGYHSLLEFVGVLGIFGTAIMVGFDASKMPKMLAFVMGAFFVLYVSLDVTANIMVEDPINNYTNVATGVPAVVGIPAAVISEVGHWLTQKVEQDFSLPNSLTVTGGDQFNLANSLMQSATQAQILDPYLKSSFAAYISNCVMPELANGTLNAETILNSNDFINAIQVNNQAILTPVYNSSNPNGDLTNCSAAWTDLDGTLTNEASSLLTANTSQWGGNGVSIISSGLTSATQWLSNNTANQSADQTIIQTATLNMFNGTAMQQGAAMTGNNGVLTSMAIAQAEQSQESSWYTGAQVFNNLMGYIYSVLQAFLFAITPLLMAATLIPGFGFAVLKNFFQVLLWLILWQPMLAIVSYIVALYGQSSYGGVLASSGGITDLNLPVISQQSSHMVLAAGFLATMVPIIAWGLVKGSLAFSDFIMAAGGGALASSAGAMAATGNVSLDNQSMNNDAFNSKNFTHALAAGVASDNLTSGMGNASFNSQYGGQSTSDASGLITNTKSHNTGSGITQTGSSGYTNSTNLSQSESALAQKKKALTEAVGLAIDKTNDWANKQGLEDSTKIGEDTGRMIGSDFIAKNGLSATESNSVASLESLYTGLTVAGLGEGILALKDLGSKGLAVSKDLDNPEMSTAEIAKRNGVSKEAVDRLAKFKNKMKANPAMVNRLEGVVRGFASKFAKAPALEKVALAAGGGLLAVLGAAGPDEVALGIGGVGVLGADEATSGLAIREAEPAVSKIVSGAETTSEGSQFNEVAQDGVSSLLRDTENAGEPSVPEDPATPPRSETPPEQEGEPKAKDPKAKDSKDEDKNPGAPKSKHNPAAAIPATGAKAEGKGEQKEDVQKSGGLDKTGSDKIHVTRSAGVGTDTKRGVSTTTALKSLLKASKQNGTDFSNALSQNFQRVQAINHQVSDAESAVQSELNQEAITHPQSLRVALGGGNESVAEALSGNRAADRPTTIPSANNPKVQKLLKRDGAASGYGSGDAPLQAPGTTAKAATTATSNAAQAAAQARQEAASGGGLGTAPRELAILGSQLSQNRLKVIEATKTAALEAAGLTAANATQAEMSAAKSFNQSKAWISYLGGQTSGVNLGDLSQLMSQGVARVIEGAPVPALTASEANFVDHHANEMNRGKAQIYNRLFGGEKGAQQMAEMQHWAQTYDVPMTLMAGIAATESGGIMPKSQSVNGDAVGGLTGIETQKADLARDPDFTNKVNTDPNFDFKEEAKRLSEFRQKTGSWSGALVMYSGNTKDAMGAEAYITTVGEFGEYASTQPGFNSVPN